MCERSMVHHNRLNISVTVSACDVTHKLPLQYRLRSAESSAEIRATRRGHDSVTVASPGDGRTGGDGPRTQSAEAARTRRPHRLGDGHERVTFPPSRRERESDPLMKIGRAHV